MKTYINEIIQKIVDSGITVPNQQIEFLLHTHLRGEVHYIEFTIEYSQNKRKNILKTLHQKFKDEYFRLHDCPLSMILFDDQVHSTREFTFCLMKYKGTHKITIIIENLIVTDIII